MSKNLRSFIAILSLAFMLLSGLFVPYTAQVQAQDREQQQQILIVWEASDESIERLQELAEEMGAEVKAVNNRRAKRLKAASNISLSQESANAKELVNWLKVQRQIISHDKDVIWPPIIIICGQLVMRL